eukprot:scaffold2534_cov260-Pinguiococcus_pyrenoidosus.AAC.22
MTGLTSCAWYTSNGFSTTSTCTGARGPALLRRWSILSMFSSLIGSGSRRLSPVLGIASTKSFWIDSASPKAAPSRRSCWKSRDRVTASENTTFFRDRRCKHARRSIASSELPSVPMHQGKVS